MANVRRIARELLQRANDPFIGLDINPEQSNDRVVWARGGKSPWLGAAQRWQDTPCVLLLIAARVVGWNEHDRDRARLGIRGEHARCWQLFEPLERLGLAQALPARCP